MRLLLVDDEDGDAELFSRAVGRIDPRVDCTHHLRPLASIEDYAEYDGVIMDRIMPGVDGLALAIAIADRYPAMPVMLLTGAPPQGYPHNLWIADKNEPLTSLSLLRQFVGGLGAPAA